MAIVPALSYVWKYRRALILVLTPLLLLPLITLDGTPKAKCAYILIWMATYWVTEAIPISATALMPAVLGPVMGLVSSKKICPLYLKDTVMLFLGGVMVAAVIEHRNLHKRIALAVLRCIGSNPKRLMLGFMIPTWFLSMWISNTATTAMMIPIVEAVLGELKRHRKASMRDIYVKEEVADENDEENGTVQVNEDSEIILMRAKDSKPTKEGLPEGVAVNLKEEASATHKALTLCIAYAATCGGMCTITGTATNLVLYGFVTERYAGYETGLHFGSWMAYALPISIIILIIAWAWLQIWFLGIKAFIRCDTNPEEQQRVSKIIDREYQKLGSMKWAEGSCLVLLICLALMWISRDLGEKGWGLLFEYNGHSMVHDAQPAVLIALLALVLPERNPFSKEARESGSGNLITWNALEKKCPWGIALLIGGGFALAELCKASGFSNWVGEALQIVGSLPTVVTVLLIALCCSMLTEVTSNTATNTIVVPILLSLAEGIKVNPLLLAFPGTLACSLSFCLPAGTPPNAIVFSKGKLTVMDMLKVGVLLNMVAVLVLTAGTWSYGMVLFDLNTFPDWAANRNNITALSNTTLNFIH